jgi:hypothetical protein
VPSWPILRRSSARPTPDRSPRPLDFPISVDRRPLMVLSPVLYVCSRYLGHTWPHPDLTDDARTNPLSTKHPAGTLQVPMNRTYLAPRPTPRKASLTTLPIHLATTDEPDILGSRRSADPHRPDNLFITMYRTYLAEGTATSGRSTRAMYETYEACVHHDRPSILGACTHDEPDILLPMYRTYLARALTMNRTYHYR